MERKKRRQFVRQFMELTEQEQQSILSLMREFEAALYRSKGIAYHNQRPITRTVKKLLQ